MFRFIFSKTFVIQVALALILGCLSVFAAYFFLKSYARSGEAIAVPELEGSDIVEAEALLKNSSLKAVVVDSLFIPDHRGGVILDQKPKGLSPVKPGREIYLTISRYKTPSVIIPNVLDQTTAIAINKLTRRGFEVGELIPTPNPCEGCAIGLQINKMDVEIGSPVAKGSVIDILVGENKNSALIATPTLFGLSADEATTILLNHQLNKGAMVYEDCETQTDSAAARVFWQSALPNSDIGIGQPVTIRLSPNLELIPRVNLDSIRATIQ